MVPAFRPDTMDGARDTALDDSGVLPNRAGVSLSRSGAVGGHPSRVGIALAAALRPSSWGVIAGLFIGNPCMRT